tara:strand:- start:7 stop:624 length:618 start_codon:yes stop_codon:yes gene_type:complete
MIFDEESLQKVLSKANNFTAVGAAVLGQTAAVTATAAGAAAASTAGMAVVGLGTTIIGTGVSAIGQAKAGASSNAVAQRNAQIQMRDAQLATQNAEFNAKIHEKQTDQRRRAMIAKQGASGVDVGDGTNLLALAEQEFIDDLNAQLIRRGGAIESQGLQDQAVLTSASGTASRSAGMAGAGASLLTGLGKTGQNYQTLKTQGVFG